MKLRTRILRVTAETGPRSIHVLRGLNRHREDFDAVLKAMRAAGEIKVYSSKRGSRWGVPGWKKRPGRVNGRPR